MPEQRQPCPCPRCNGALVSARTLRRHRASCVVASEPTPIPSFSAWSRHHTGYRHPETIAGQPSNHALDSNDDNEVNEDRSPRSLHHDSQYPWPSKRLRSSTVCVSHNLFSFRRRSYSECNQSQPSQDGQHDLNINIHNDFNNSLIQDDENIPHISHHQHDGTNTPPPENTDDSNPGDFDEYEQQDAALQAEWQAHATAIQALHQLRIDQSPTTGGGSEEADDSPTALSRIEIIKTTQQFIKEIHAATLENGNLDDDVIHRLRNPPEEPTSISDPDIRLSRTLPGRNQCIRRNIPCLS